MVQRSAGFKRNRWKSTLPKPKSTAINSLVSKIGPAEVPFQKSGLDFYRFHPKPAEVPGEYQNLQISPARIWGLKVC